MNSITKPSDDLLEEARQLLEMWSSVSRQHVSIAGGCACGVGGVTLLLEDFEQDIIDFLTGQAERAKRTDVAEFLAAHAVDGATGRWSVGALLARLGDAGSAAAAGDVPAFLLERLGKTLRSFARLHG
jgi:hypothetical protein